MCGETCHLSYVGFCNVGPRPYKYLSDHVCYFRLACDRRTNDWERCGKDQSWIQCMVSISEKRLPAVCAVAEQEMKEWLVVDKTREKIRTMEPLSRKFPRVETGTVSLPLLLAGAMVRPATPKIMGAMIIRYEPRFF